MRILRWVFYIFDQPREELSHTQRLLVDFSRFVYRTPRRIVSDRCLTLASALAYQTLLGIVPALAITMAVLSYSAFDASRTQLMDKMVNALYPLEAGTWSPDGAADRATLEKLNHQGKTLVRDSIAQFAQNAGKVGAAGFLALMLAVIFLFRSIEQSFNLLWEVPKARPWGRHSVRSFTFLVSIPAMIWLSLLVKKVLALLPGLTPGSGSLASFVWQTAYPYLCVAAALMAIYRLVPNKKVHSRPAWAAGFLAALVLEICRHLFTYYSVKFMSASHVYGALAVVPLMMVWLYFSWAIILFGAEAAHVLQHIDVPERKEGHFRRGPAAG